MGGLQNKDDSSNGIRTKSLSILLSRFCASVDELKLTVVVLSIEVVLVATTVVPEIETEEVEIDSVLVTLTLADPEIEISA